MKKNVASQVIGAQMVDASDGSAFTSTVSVDVTVDGGTQASGGGTVTHEGGGFHSYTPTQAETNGDHVAFTFSGTGAIPVTVQAYTTFPQTGDNFTRLGAPAGASVSADIADVPTVSEFNARTLVAADYFDPTADSVTVGTNNDKSGYTISGTLTTLDALDTAQDSQHSQTQTDIAALNDPSAATIADAVWDETITAATHNDPTSAGRRLRTLSSNITRNETAQGAGTGTNQIQFDTGASAVDGSYDPSIVAIVNGTGLGQARMITEYDGTSKTATVHKDWKVAPDATSEFIIIADAGYLAVNEGLAQSGASTSITLNTLASSVDDSYNGQTVFVTSGTGADQARVITDYDGTTKVATVEIAWVTNPDSTSNYFILPVSLINEDLIASTVWSETTRTLTAGTNISLAKGTGVTGFNDPSTADILASGDVDGYSIEEVLKLIAAALAGTLSGAATTTITINAVDGSKARLTATVDADGNRSVVTKDVTG